MGSTDQATATATLPAGRRAVLYALRRRGDATAEQLARQLGMSVSGARQHLGALARDGTLNSLDQGELATAQHAYRGPLPVSAPKRPRQGPPTCRKITTLWPAGFSTGKTIT